MRIHPVHWNGSVRVSSILVPLIAVLTLAAGPVQARDYTDYQRYGRDLGTIVLDSAAVLLAAADSQLVVVSDSGWLSIYDPLAGGGSALQGSVRLVDLSQTPTQMVAADGVVWVGDGHDLVAVDCRVPSQPAIVSHLVVPDGFSRLGPLPGMLAMFSAAGDTVRFLDSRDPVAPRFLNQPVFTNIGMGDADGHHLYLYSDGFIQCYAVVQDTALSLVGTTPLSTSWSDENGSWSYSYHDLVADKGFVLIQYHHSWVIWGDDGLSWSGDLVAMGTLQDDGTVAIQDAVIAPAIVPLQAGGAWFTARFGNGVYVFDPADGTLDRTRCFLGFAQEDQFRHLVVGDGWYLVSRDGRSLLLRSGLPGELPVEDAYYAWDNHFPIHMQETGDKILGPVEKNLTALRADAHGSLAVYNFSVEGEGQYGGMGATWDFHLPGSRVPGYRIPGIIWDVMALTDSLLVGCNYDDLAIMNYDDDRGYYGVATIPDFPAHWLRRVGDVPLAVTLDGLVVRCDFSDPSRPSLVDTLDVGERVWDVAADSTALYLLGDAGRVWRLAVPPDGGLAFRDSFTLTPAPSHLVADGNLLAGYSGTTVFLYEVRDGSAPVLWETDLPLPCRDVALREHRLYAADGLGGLYAFDCSSPATPRPRGVLPLLPANQVEAVADGVYVLTPERIVRLPHDIGNAVPVMVTGLNATVENGAVHLTWSTSEPVGAGDLRLAGTAADRTWLVPVQGAGTRWEAVDDRVDGRQRVTYVLSLRRGDGTWRDVATASVDLPAVSDRLLSPSPNPFNGAVDVRFVLAHRGRVTVTVYDLAGRRVKRLLAAVLPAGEHRVLWRGVDDAGRAVAAGPYAVRMTSDRGAWSRRVMFVK